MTSTTRSGSAQQRRGWRSLLAALIVFTTMMSGLPAATAAPTTGILNGRYGIDQVFSVLRSPAYPACSSETAYSSWRLRVIGPTLSSAYPYSEATDAAVDLGSDYLAIVASGNSSAPWGIARYTPDGDEVRYNGTTWVTEPVGGWTTEVPFTAEGQLYGLGNEGFMHASTPTDYGNFFSNLGVLEPLQIVEYTPLTEFNNCESSRAVADPAAVANYPVPGSPLARNALQTLAPSTGAFSPAFSPAATSYDLSLPSGTSAISFQFLTEEDGATTEATFNGASTTLSSGSTASLALRPGVNVFSITVTASDSSTRTYTVTITVAEVASGAQLAATGLTAQPWGPFGAALLVLGAGCVVAIHIAGRRTTITDSDLTATRGSI